MESTPVRIGGYPVGGSGEHGTASHDFGKASGRRHGMADVASVNRSGAYVFTLALFCIYAAPTIISVQLGLDPDVSFWIGSFGLSALLIPIFLLLQYPFSLARLRRGTQSKGMLLATILSPAVLLCFVGGHHMSVSRYLYDQLKARDCSGSGGLDEKYTLQRAYEEAHKVYDTCLNRLHVANGNQSLDRRPLLQSCEEWVDATPAADDGFYHKHVEQPLARLFGWEWPWADRHSTDLPKWRGTAQGDLWRYTKEFHYLAQAEVNHVCSGFCAPGPMLWSSYFETGRRGGKCAPLVAMKFLTVEREGAMLFGVAAISAAISIGSFLAGRSTLERFGYV